MNNPITLVNTTDKAIVDALFATVKSFVDTKEELLSQKEAADFMKVSVTTIVKMEKDGVITGYVNGDTLRYKKTELLAAFKPRTFKH